MDHFLQFFNVHFLDVLPALGPLARLQAKHAAYDFNHTLRQQLATALNDNKQLAEKIGVASTRLETLLTQIPGEET